MRSPVTDLLWIPGAAREALEQETTTWHCNLCGNEWARKNRQAFERHLGQCARKHDDEIQQMVKMRQEDPTQWVPDPEIREHMDRVAARMIREGRLEVHPNERAGF